MNRLESGVIQFGEDWPGLFLRGDDALRFSQHLGSILDKLDSLGESVIFTAVLRGLQSDLTSVADARVTPLKLKPIADCLGSSE